MQWNTTDNQDFPASNRNTIFYGSNGPNMYPTSISWTSEQWLETCNMTEKYGVSFPSLFKSVVFPFESNISSLSTLPSLSNRPCTRVNLLCSCTKLFVCTQAHCCCTSILSFSWSPSVLWWNICSQISALAPGFLWNNSTNSKYSGIKMVFALLYVQISTISYVRLKVQFVVICSLCYCPNPSLYSPVSLHYPVN